MTKAEAIKELTELKDQMHMETFSWEYEERIDAVISFIQSQPDIIHCKECSNFNPNLKYCTQWECTMYKNSYCDQGERRKDGQ